MKKVPLIILVLSAFAFCGALQASSQEIGYVNFKAVVEKSKQGQQEKSSFETLKKQMSETLEKTDKELEDLAKKLEDQEYMDGLSPTAEQELKTRFQTLSQEFSKYQNQYYQLLQQANYRMLQTLHDHVCGAAEAVRERNNLKMILNEDSTFASVSTLNFTEEVVKELDKRFEIENSGKTAQVAPKPETKAAPQKAVK